MKKCILLLVVLMSTICFSQKGNDKKATSFTYDENGLNSNSITVDIKKLDKKELYEKALDWFDKKYTNPDEVITKKEKNDKIKFETFVNNAICYGVGADYGCEDLTYNIELSFEDKQYKMKILKLSYIDKKGKDIKMNLNKSDFHEQSGKIKDDYTKAPSQIETLLNNLNKSLLNYINGDDQEDEW
ncbi:MAG: DUF4468 domain-containing protein [Flavobacteriaceae bacterium]|jgi:hypothetical protein|nr:DUF4468 domain-containing protein [Flavobacteriaceae bacterium]